MRAFQLLEAGQTADWTEIETPQPGPNEVRVRISACGLNFADLLLEKGKYQDMPPAPFTLGLEAAGVVDALGAEVTDLTIGDRVAVYGGHGGLAEYGCFERTRVMSVPDGLDLVQAAGFQIAYGTSHLALTHKANLQPGETLVVLGAAGGVGLTAVEIGKALGARVIAVARGADKLEIAKRAGADAVIEADTDDLRQVLKDLGGADVVYDPVGGDLFDAAFRATKPDGRILTIGFASGTVPELRANHMLVKNISVMGFYWGGYLSFAPHLLFDSLQTLLGWQAEGRITPHVSHVLPAAEARDGLELLRQRKSTGKVVITL